MIPRVSGPGEDSRLLVGPSRLGGRLLARDLPRDDPSRWNCRDQIWVPNHRRVWSRPNPLDERAEPPCGARQDQPRSNRFENEGRVRGQLEDLGFRVIVIRHDESMQDQITDHPEDFGQGGQA